MTGINYHLKEECELHHNRVREKGKIKYDYVLVTLLEAKA
jgi:hypothetical protein